MPIRAVLAEDHELVRNGLRALLEGGGIAVIGEAGDGREAVHLTGMLRPDAVVVDLFMPLLNGLDAAVAIRRIQPDAAIVLLTMCGDLHQIWAARRAGIGGYVMKTDGADDLIMAIQTVANGEPYVSRTVAAILRDAVSPPDGTAPASLTRRQRQVLQLIAEGRKPPEIATLLDVSLETVHSWGTELRTKLNVRDTAGLVRHAVRSGLIKAAALWGATL
jgi:DNA-binding NarL/FixJ family response regulator